MDKADIENHFLQKVVTGTGTKKNGGMSVACKLTTNYEQTVKGRKRKVKTSKWNKNAPDLR